MYAVRERKSTVTTVAERARIVVDLVRLALRGGRGVSSSVAESDDAAAATVSSVVCMDCVKPWDVGCKENIALFVDIESSSIGSDAAETSLPIRHDCDALSSVLLRCISTSVPFLIDCLEKQLQPDIH